MVVAGTVLVFIHIMVCGVMVAGTVLVFINIMG